MIMRGGSSLFRNPGTTIRFTIVGWIRLLLLALIALSWAPTTLTSAAEAGGGSANATDSSGEEAEPAVAVLFPWFSLAIGTFAYLVLTRLLPWFPYTALMFVSGAVMGISVVHLGHTNLLTESISDYWLNIDSEVLLLVFLPGLIAKDAMQLDATLFRASFWQCAVFAFPVVLAGTTLTALVCYYVFPYGWSFNLAMTVGSVRCCRCRPLPAPLSMISLLAKFVRNSRGVRLACLYRGADFVGDRSRCGCRAHGGGWRAAEIADPHLGGEVRGGDAAWR
jgi:hypothetical protein